MKILVDIQSAKESLDISLLIKKIPELSEAKLMPPKDIVNIYFRDRREIQWDHNKLMTIPELYLDDESYSFLKAALTAVGFKHIVFDKPVSLWAWCAFQESFLSGISYDLLAPLYERQYEVQEKIKNFICAGDYDRANLLNLELYEITFQLTNLLMT